MICKCPSCGSALKYDPQSKKMVCAYCGSSYEPSEVNHRESMECNIYTCTSCGAELMVDGVETATFCSYCGQPTIVFSRVSKELQPDLIIPFSVTKEEAVQKIRDSLNKSVFVPKEIKNFDVERVRGIYMPFWVSDVDYEGKAIVKSNVRKDVWRHFYRHGICNFKRMIADASQRLNDESSQRLEPYDMSKAVPFDISYLSGFYADRYDVENEEAEKIIKKRAKAYYNDEMLKSVRGSSQEIVEESAEVFSYNEDYVMLPVWFLTFMHNDKPYTFLVNGQTGKVVGGVPYKKSIRTLLIIIFSLILVVPCYFLSDFFIQGEDTLESILAILVVTAIIFAAGLSRLNKVKKANELTTSTVMRDMVKEREEEQ